MEATGTQVDLVVPLIVLGGMLVLFIATGIAEWLDRRDSSDHEGWEA